MLMRRCSTTICTTNDDNDDDDDDSMSLPLTFGAAGGWDVGTSRSELFDDMLIFSEKME